MQSETKIKSPQTVLHTQVIKEKCQVKNNRHLGLCWGGASDVQDVQCCTAANQTCRQVAVLTPEAQDTPGISQFRFGCPALCHRYKKIKGLKFVGSKLTG